MLNKLDTYNFVVEKIAIVEDKVTYLKSEVERFKHNEACNGYKANKEKLDYNKGKLDVLKTIKNHFEAVLEDVSHDKEVARLHILEELISSSGNWIDNYNLQGFFIETNEEDDKLIRKIKGIENGNKTH